MNTPRDQSIKTRGEETPRYGATVDNQGNAVEVQ